MAVERGRADRWAGALMFGAVMEWAGVEVWGVVGGASGVCRRMGRTTECVGCLRD